MELDQADKIRAFAAINSAREQMQKAAEILENLFTTGCLRLREDEIKAIRRDCRHMTSARSRVLAAAKDFEGIKPNDPIISPFQQKEMVQAETESIRERRLEV